MHILQNNEYLESNSHPSVSGKFLACPSDSNPILLKYNDEFNIEDLNGYLMI